MPSIDGPTPTGTKALPGTGKVVLMGGPGAFAAVIEYGVFTRIDVGKQFVDHEVGTAQAVLATL